MHVGNILLQLLQCTEVGLVMTVSSITDMAVKKRKDLSLAKGLYLLCSSTKSEHVISGQ